MGPRPMPDENRAPGSTGTGALLLQDEQESKSSDKVVLYETGLELVYDNESGRIRVQVVEVEGFPYDQENFMLALNAALEECRSAKAVALLVKSLTSRKSDGDRD